MAYVLSERMDRLQPSPIREILSVAGDANMISFAGGLPAECCMPSFAPGDMHRADLQYGPTEGEPWLRERIAEDLRARGISASADNVLVLSGSQQGIDLVAKLIIDKDTPVAVESPTYLAALQSFSLFGARYCPFQINTLEDSLSNETPGLLYVNPTFQNPTGYCYTREERMRLARYCDDKRVLLFEDDPYRDLVYDACEREPVVSMVRHTSWIYQSSFSKTVAPGLRLGYLACSPDLFPHLVKLKQAADLHSSRVSQRLVARLLDHANETSRVTELQQHYRYKRDRFNDALVRHFSSQASWQVPAGGLFFWLKLATARPARTLEWLSEAVSQGVTFMPGEPFFANTCHASGYIRLNFSHTATEQFDEGLSLSLIHI